MAPAFYEPVNVEEIATGSALTIPRAKALYDAVVRLRDYTVVQLLRPRSDSAIAFEYIVVDVECDGIPSKNVYGIQYRERLALFVPKNSKQLVEVLALRRGFPTLLHQNQSVADTPANLCLYFEPAPAVLRTWTPQKFLRRIQWWLEQSAKGTLHPADQPVEQLFFVGKHELVLPWNFDELQKQPGHRFVITRSEERPDGGETYFVRSVQGVSDEASVAPIEVALPPIVQGHIERDPATLGELVDTLAARGVDLLSALANIVEKRVSEHGAPEFSDNKFSIVLLHVPVTRTEGGDHERIARRAFLFGVGSMRLGELVGALFNLKGTYFRAIGVLGQRSTAWKSERLFPMEVLRSNDTVAARTYSGITNAGPAGVLVGAGSLGSAMLQLWSRSGWGSWTVIDKDHIRPHNLVRHVAYAHHIGQLKGDVVTQLYDDLMQGAGRMKAVCADATDLSDSRVLDELQAAEVVVDVSTTLEYPRLASTTGGLGRHVSVFITPSGNGAVLLSEDASCTLRLRTLEAQYYRALIAESWGTHHLDGNRGSFWSGASCRDISSVMSYCCIVAHAGMLVEQVQRATTRNEATIRVWNRDSDSGAVDLHELTPDAERHISLDGIDVYFDSAFEKKLVRLRKRGLPNETGGVLLGYHDLNVNALVLVDALSAPEDSGSSPAFFERGVQGVAAEVNEVARRTAGIVGYVGEWHSHPPGYSANPSGLDLKQLVYLTLGMANDGLPALSVIVGDDDIRVMKGSLQPDTQCS